MSFILIEGKEGSQGSDEWLKFREGKIGASDCPSILGINPWETQLECWERFVLGKRKPKTSAMKRGNDLEIKARDLFCRLFEDYYEPVVAQWKENPRIIASLDGWNGKCILEVKCPNKESHLSAKRGEVPSYYLAQMQHQMMVMGCSDAWYCSFDGEMIATIPVRRDEKLIEEIKKSESHFLKSVIDLEPPLPCDKDWREIDNPEQIVKSFRYKQLAMLIEELEIEKQEIRKYLIGNAVHPREMVGDLKIQRITHKGRINYEKIVEDYKVENLETYRSKPSEIWRIV